MAPKNSVQRPVTSLPEGAAAKELFKRHFGYPPARFVAVPGRVELLGSFAEPNEGLVLSAAIDRRLVMASTPRTDGRFEAASSTASSRTIFWSSDTSPKSGEPHWTDPIKLALGALRRRGTHFTGLSLAVHSSIPSGLGLGEESALAIATAFSIRESWPFRLTELGLSVPPRRDERGRLPSTDERERRHWVRMLRSACPALDRHGGLSAALALLFGRAGHAIAVDARFETCDPIPLIGEALVLCWGAPAPTATATAACAGASSSAGIGVSAAETVPRAARIESILECCRSAALTLRGKSLRSIEPPQLKAQRGILSEPQFRAARHVTGEIQRVIFAERALRADDHVQFGQFMIQSHESARDLLGNSNPEIEAIVALAHGHKSCLGTRLMGLGFGGATVSLVAHHVADEFAKDLKQRFEKQHPGRELEARICCFSDSA